MRLCTLFILIPAITLSPVDAASKLLKGAAIDCHEQSICHFSLLSEGKKIESSPMYHKFTRTFGQETCKFYTSRKNYRPAYMSSCDANGWNQVEGVFYTDDSKIIVHPKSRGEPDVIQLWPAASDVQRAGGDRAVDENEI